MKGADSRSSTPSQASIHNVPRAAQVFHRPGQDARRAGSSSVAAHVMNCSWVSAPTCTNATWLNPAALNSRIPATCRRMSGPHGICDDTSSSRTVLDAAANDAGTGSSALTFQSPREPAELMHRSPDGDLLIGIVSQRYLSDSRLPG